MKRLVQCCLLAAVAVIVGLGFGATGVDAATLAQLTCQVGYYDDGSACVPAPPGTFVDVEGAVAATPCSPGTYQPASGAISCLLAQPGYFVDVVGSIQQFMCPVGYTSQAGATSCSLIGPIVVEIDIKPGSSDNCINVNSHGVIPVAVLGSAVFDVADVDPGSVTLAGMEIKAAGKSNKLLAHIDDVNGDAYDDLVLQIEDSDNTLAPGSTDATLEGSLYGGGSFEGTDLICIVP